MKDFPISGIEEARQFLKDRFRADPSTVEHAGEGAWSICFGFKCKGEDLVIRFGNQVDDFQKDRFAHTFAAPRLPIPKVIEIGQAFDGYFAVSTRVKGKPLESSTMDEWITTVPAVVSALEDLRLADLTSTTGFGIWDGNGNASYTGWFDYLLTVGEDTPGKRTHGWRENLIRHTDGEKAFRWGFDLLKSLANTSVPRCLVHGDLLNRNVLTDGGAITGVFDCGCSSYGDHLYDLAWFEFWAPWHPTLDVDKLKIALIERWRICNYKPTDMEARLKACYLHIWLDHLAYNAFTQNWSTLSETAERMKQLMNRGIDQALLNGA